MGRLGFGDAETFREVVRLGHARGFTVSGDLLFNLPAQTLDADEATTCAGRSTSGSITSACTTW